MLKFLQVLEPVMVVTLLASSWSFPSGNEGILKFLCYFLNKGKQTFMNGGIHFYTLNKKKCILGFLNTSAPSSLCVFPLPWPPILFLSYYSSATMAVSSANSCLPLPVVPHTFTSLSHPTQVCSLPLSMTAAIPPCCYSIS